MKNWIEYYEIVGYRDFCGEKVDYATEYINQYQPRCDALSNAINTLKGYVDELNDQRIALKNIPNQANKWTGSNAKKNSERFFSGGDIYTEYEWCISSLETKVGELESERNNISSSIADMQGVLNDYYPQYAEMCTLVNNYWDE